MPRIWSRLINSACALIWHSLRQVLLLLNTILSYCQDCSLGSREERKAICTVLRPECHNVRKSPWSILVPCSAESHSHVQEEMQPQVGRQLSLRLFTVPLSVTQRALLPALLSRIGGARFWGDHMRIRVSQGNFTELRSSAPHKPLKIPRRRAFQMHEGRGKPA